MFKQKPVGVSGLRTNAVTGANAPGGGEGRGLSHLCWVSPPTPQHSWSLRLPLKSNTCDIMCVDIGCLQSLRLSFTPGRESGGADSEPLDQSGCCRALLLPVAELGTPPPRLSSPLAWRETGNCSLLRDHSRLPVLILLSKPLLLHAVRCR